MEITPLKLAIWFVLFMCVLDLGLDMISKPNTIENVIGFFIVIIAVIISIKTKCLTEIEFRKHEKRN